MKISSQKIGELKKQQKGFQYKWNSKTRFHFADCRIVEGEPNTDKRRRLRQARSRGKRSEVEEEEEVDRDRENFREKKRARKGR